MCSSWISMCSISNSNRLADKFNMSTFPFNLLNILYHIYNMYVNNYVKNIYCMISNIFWSVAIIFFDLQSVNILLILIIFDKLKLEISNISILLL